MSPISPANLHRIFKNLDKNDAGLVSVGQLHRLLHQIGIQTALEDLERIVGGSSLDYFDFLFFYEAITKTTKERDCDYEHDLLGAFKVFDLNGDGYISSEELQSVLSRLGLWDSTAGQDCKDMIRVYDENCDGLLDFDEFKNMMSVNN